MPTLLAALPLLWLVAVPLAILAVSAFKPTGFLLDPGFTLEHLATYRDPDLWRLIGRTLVFALGSAAMALALGTALAVLLERTDLPGRSAFAALLVVPMAMPPFLLAIGWIMLASPRSGALNVALIETLRLESAPFDIYSMGGMIFVEGLALTPSAYLVIAPSLRNFDAVLEEAAQMAGAGPWLIVTRVVLPLLAPALAGTLAYLVIVGIMVFDIPGTIGLPAKITLLSTHIYDLAHHGPTGLPEYGPMSAIALITIAALAVLCLAYQRLIASSGRYVTVAGKATRPRQLRLGRGRPWALAFVLAYLAAGVAAPIAALVWSSLLPFPMPVSAEALARLTLVNHAAFLSEPQVGRAALHSLVVALAAASAVAILALLVSWVVVRTRAPGRRALDLLAFMPLAMPGVLIGTALIYVYLTVRIAPIYGSIWIIAIAHVTVYMSFASRAMNAAMAQLAPELEEAARMGGAAWGATMLRIVAPLVLPAMAAVWIWVFSHSLRELSAALMLQGVNNATLPTLLYAYWTQGQPARTAAVGVWLVIAMVGLVAAGQLLQKLTADRGR